MADVILDASALLALALGEPGAGAVQDVLGSACMSTVNYSEVIAKLVEKGPAAAQLVRALALNFDKVAFDEAMAVEAGMLRGPTRHLGLSLGDRACLALAKLRGGTAFTADKAWSELDLGIDVLVIR